MSLILSPATHRWVEGTEGSASGWVGLVMEETLAIRCYDFQTRPSSLAQVPTRVGPFSYFPAPPADRTLRACLTQKSAFYGSHLHLPVLLKSVLDPPFPALSAVLSVPHLQCHLCAREPALTSRCGLSQRPLPPLCHSPQVSTGQGPILFSPFLIPGALGKQ